MLLKTNTKRRRGGIALISVLLLLAVLTVIAVSVLAVTRMRTQISGRNFERIQVTELLDSALRLTLIEITASKDPERAVIVGGRSERFVKVFDRDFRVELELESGRVDLNYASLQVLEALFQAHGNNRQHSSELAARVVDWRDVDDTTTAYGAERAEYQRAGRAIGPRNAPFESVDELRQVLGFEDSSNELLDSLTVYSHTSMPAISTSNPFVQSALRTLSTTSTENAREVDSSVPAVSSEGTSLVGQVIRLRSCAKTERYSLCRVLVSRLTGASNNPFLIFLWESQFDTTH